MFTIIAFEPTLVASSALLLAQEDLRDAAHQLGWSVLWTTPESLRIPLLVIDNLNVELQMELNSSLRQIASTSTGFKLAFSRLELVGPQGRPTAIALRFSEGAESLSEATLRVRGAADSLGVEPDPRPWMPALRLGRVHASMDAIPIDDVLRDVSDKLSGVYTICNELVVLESSLFEGEVRTQVVERMALRPAPRSGPPGF